MKLVQLLDVATVYRECFVGLLVSEVLDSTAAKIGKRGR